MSAPLDGNAIAGLLRELFAVDMTTARYRCESCGATNELAGVEVYLDAPGAVLRCPGCTEVIARIVRAPGRAWLDLRGVSWVQLRLPDESAT